MINIVFIDVDKLDEANPDVIEKVRKEFNKNFCIGFTNYLYKNNKIDRNECIKIKDKYIG